jgi:hypothetical protein
MNLTRNRQALTDLATSLHRENQRHVYEQQTWGELHGPVRILSSIIRTEDGDQLRKVKPLATCTSHACLAGTAVMHAGYDLLIDADDYEPGTYNDRDTYVSTEWCMDKDKRVREISDVGREHLGLDSDESDLLFHGAWKPAEGMEVWEAIDKLASGARLSDVTASRFVDDNRWAFKQLDECPIEIH